MNADERRSMLNGLSEQIIACAFQVANALGPGFLEKVYENAMAHELRKKGLAVQQRERVVVLYDGIVVGEYIPDLIVNKSVILELKAFQNLDEIHLAQCLNALKATGRSLGLLINFAKPRIEVRRVVNSF